MTSTLPSLNFCRLASPLLHHALGLARSPAVCSLLKAGLRPSFAIISSFFGKSVAPDGVLRIRICTLREAANQLMEEGFFKEPCKILPINTGQGTSGISLYDSRLMKILPINVGQGDPLGRTSYCIAVSSWRTSNPGSCGREEEGLGLGAHQ